MQQRLKALLDLQGILQRQELTQEQLKLVRDQVSALAPVSKPVLSAPQTLTPNIPATSTPSLAVPPTQTIPQPLQQLLNPGTLAGLIKATAARQQPTPPPRPTNILPQIPTGSSTPQPVVTSTSENPLITTLRARGILPSVPAAVPTSAAPAPPLASVFPFIVPGQVRYTAPVTAPQISNASDITIDVKMSTASIKM